MVDISTWVPERVDRFLQDLILDVYYEFVYHQRDLRLWLAGMETIQQIKP